MSRNLVKDEEKKRILLMHKEGMKNVEIAKITGRHVTTICRILKSFGIDAKNHHKLTNDDINNIVKLYKKD